MHFRGVCFIFDKDYCLEWQIFKTFVRSLRCCLLQLGANVKFTFLPHEGAKNTWKRDSNGISKGPGCNFCGGAHDNITAQRWDKHHFEARNITENTHIYAGYLYHSLAGFYETEVQNRVHFITSESVIHGIFLYLFYIHFHIAIKHPSVHCKNFADLCGNSFFFPSSQ